MDFLPVVLWTDALFFLLLAMGALFAWHARRSEQLRAAWLRVGRSPVAMAAAVVMLAYLAVGVADSLHFRPRLPDVPAAAAAKAGPAYASEVLSALDVVLAPLRAHAEKTYSAPFATHLYAKETVASPDGHQLRVYPRLIYGAAHLADPAREQGGDVATRLGRALAWAVPAWLLMVGLVALRVARGGRSELAAGAGGNAAGRGWAAALAAIARGRTVIAWRAAIMALGAVVLLVAAGVALAPYYHVLGTDKVGQDVLYLALKSIRTALIIGTLTTLVMLPFAVALGVMAGYLGGWVDDVIQYTYTVLSAIPGVLLIAAAVLMMQVVIDTHPHWFATAAERSDARLLALCAILGVTSWTSLCRLLRGETLKLRELDYVQAARAFGVRIPAILRRHVLPNVMHIVLISLVMDFSGLVLAEAVLSYVGVGVDPTTISFGTMINGARAELARDPMVWWSLAAAFVFMFVLVLAANFFADVVRDAFDPRRG